MIYLLPILALVLYVRIVTLFGPGQSTVKKGRHYPRLVDTLLLKGALPLRKAWFWGGINGSFVVTQAMVDAANWTEPDCIGDSSKIIGRTAGFRLPTRGSVRLAYRLPEYPLVPGGSLMRAYKHDEIELMAMGHDPKQIDPKTGRPGKKIWESLGTAKVGDLVEYVMWSTKRPETGIDVLVASEGRYATLPIGTRFGLPLGHYQGAPCPAINDVTL